MSRHAVPQVRYAKSEGVHIAYEVVGNGPLDLLLTSTWVNSMEAFRELPSRARYMDRLALFSRVITYDRWGVGLSDPAPPDAALTLEHWMQDALAVLDAVRSERTAVLGGEQVSGLTAMLLAGTHPDRVAALVLINTSARIAEAPGYPWGLSEVGQQRLEERIEQAWPDAALPFDFVAPSAVHDDDMRAWWSRSQRMGASPATARALSRIIFESDVRDILPTIRVPTLVLHAKDNRLLSAEHGRYLAENIPHAKYVEVSGADHLWTAGDSLGPVMDEIEEFLTGVRPLPESDRVLATVLFTDIVTSTERSAQVGDRRWKDLLDQHDTLIRRELERHRGQLVKNTGDGILATFDGPARAIRCAQAIAISVKVLGIEVRAGLHTGEVELRGKDVTGMGVNIAARVMDAAGPGEVVVSSTVKDLVAGSGIVFDDPRTRALKGVPGRWALYAVKA